MNKGDTYIKKTNKLEFIIHKVDKVDVIFHERHYPALKIMTIKAFLEVYEVKPVEVVEPMGFWERRRHSDLMSQMDNQPPQEDTHGSY